MEYKTVKISYFARVDTPEKIDAGRKIIRQGGSCSDVLCEECPIAGEKEICLTACNSAILAILKTMGFGQEEREEYPLNFMQLEEKKKYIRRGGITGFTILNGQLCEGNSVSRYRVSQDDRFKEITPEIPEIILGEK